MKLLARAAQVSPIMWAFAAFCVATVLFAPVALFVIGLEMAYADV